MKLWLLTAKESNVGFDEMSSCVVRAPTEADARIIADQWGGDEPPGFWQDAEYAFCEELLAAGKPGILVHDISYA